MNFKNFKPIGDYTTMKRLPEGKANVIILITVDNDAKTISFLSEKKSKDNKPYKQIRYRLSDDPADTVRLRNIFENDAGKYPLLDILNNYLKSINSPDYEGGEELSFSSEVINLAEARDEMSQVIQKGTSIPMWINHKENVSNGKTYQNINFYYSQKSYDERDKEVRTVEELSQVELQDLMEL
jgi:hypothetical protein